MSATKGVHEPRPCLVNPPYDRGTTIFTKGGATGGRIGARLNRIFSTSDEFLRAPTLFFYKIFFVILSCYDLLSDQPFLFLTTITVGRLFRGRILSWELWPQGLLRRRKQNPYGAHIILWTNPFGPQLITDRKDYCGPVPCSLTTSTIAVEFLMNIVEGRVSAWKRESKVTSSRFQAHHCYDRKYSWEGNRTYHYKIAHISPLIK